MFCVTCCIQVASLACIVGLVVVEVTTTIIDECSIIIAILQGCLVCVTHQSDLVILGTNVQVLTINFQVQLVIHHNNLIDTGICNIGSDINTATFNSCSQPRIGRMTTLNPVEPTNLWFDKCLRCCAECQ